MLIIMTTRVMPIDSTRKVRVLKLISLLFRIFSDICFCIDFKPRIRKKLIASMNKLRRNVTIREQSIEHADAPKFFQLMSLGLVASFKVNPVFPNLVGIDLLEPIHPNNLRRKPT